MRAQCFVVTVGAYQTDSRRRYAPRQLFDCRKRRVTCVMQVLQDNQSGTRACQRFDHSAEGLLKSLLFPVRLQRGQDRQIRTPHAYLRDHLRDDGEPNRIDFP